MPKKNLTHNFVKTVTVDKQTDFYDTVKSGLGLRVSPGGAKTFFYRYRFNGKIRRYSIDRFSNTFTLSDARDRIDELRSYVKKGGDPIGDEKANKECAHKTLKDVVDAYKEIHLPVLKQSTQDDYKNRIKHILRGEGKDKTKKRGFDGDRYIKDINRYEILDFLQEIAKTAPTNAQRIQAILSGIFKFALDREWIDSNPASKISLKRKKRVGKKKWQNVVFNEKQIRVLWKAFDEHTEPVGSLFKMLLITGQRAGETRLMKWKNIDFENKLWRIPGADTKNGFEHFVPLSDMAIEILEQARPWTSGTFVFESTVKKGNPINHPQKAAQRLRNESGVKEFNIHSLRTTFATGQAELGTPPQILSKLMNHKKPGAGSTITAIYNRYDYDREKRTAMNKWSNELKKIILGKHTNIHKIA